MTGQSRPRPLGGYRVSVYPPLRADSEHRIGHWSKESSVQCNKNDLANLMAVFRSGLSETVQRIRRPCTGKQHKIREPSPRAFASPCLALSLSPVVHFSWRLFHRRELQNSLW